MHSNHRSRAASKLWMVMDAVTVFFAALLATLHEFQTGPLAGAEELWRGTLIHGRSIGLLLALLCGFTVALILISRRMHLYTPTRVASFLDEQRLSIQE